MEMVDEFMGLMRLIFTTVEVGVRINGNITVF
jgi:hypothetical protein